MSPSCRSLCVSLVSAAGTLNEAGQVCKEHAALLGRLFEPSVNLGDKGVAEAALHLGYGPLVA